MMEHETESIALKMADVDKEMVPVIQWLNGFDRLFTTYCCEGDEKQSPYFQFYCHCPLTLSFVLATISGYAEVNVEYWYGLIRYVARFYSIKNLKDFNLLLESKKWRSQFEKYIK